MDNYTIQDRNDFFALDALCRQITPYLSGKLEKADESMLRGDDNDLAIIQQLYSEIKNAHPEAGESYWLTRTWDLLYWQPVYVSMAAIYGMKMLPGLDGFAQKRTGMYVMGYCFSSVRFTRAPIEELISKAGLQLSRLLNHYRLLLDSWLRCRPGFANQLLADFLLSSLKKLHQIRPEMDSKQVLYHAKLWLKACNLPLKNMASLSTTTTGDLGFIRRSCCLVYKTEGGELCSDCPRVKRSLQTNRDKECTS